MIIAKVSNAEIRKRSGRFDRAKFDATSEAQIEQAEREAGIDEARLGPVQVIVPGPNVRRIRDGMKLSQEDFADRFGLSLRTVQEWEQRRRSPDGPARLLIRLIELDPKAVERAARSQAEPR